jgi:hypothetical protein
VRYLHGRRFLVRASLQTLRSASIADAGAPGPGMGLGNTSGRIVVQTGRAVLELA